MARSRRGRIALGAALVMALPVVVACNSIIGLSDYDKGQCSAARCEEEGGRADQFVPDGGPDVLQDAPIDVRGADPVSWAKWPMPNYGDAGTGGGTRMPNLVVQGDSVVDTVTGLTWRKTLLPGQASATTAEAECRKILDGGWRAPKRIELVTLIDYARPSPPFIDNMKFMGIVNQQVWTTSEVRPFVAAKDDHPYWAVSFATGEVEKVPGNFMASVLCVRAK